MEMFSYDMKVYDDHESVPRRYIISGASPIDDGKLKMAAFILDGGTELRECEDTPIALAETYATIENRHHALI